MKRKYELYQDLGRGLESLKTGLSPLVMLLLTVPRRYPGAAHLERTLTIVYTVFSMLTA